MRETAEINGKWASEALPNIADLTTASQTVHYEGRSEIGRGRDLNPYKARSRLITCLREATQML